MISVVIPSYNRQVSLRRALDSVIQQSSPPDQIIVVDDGSTDGTAKMLGEHYPDVLLIKQPQSGVSAARNAGIKAADHDWLAFLDSDDEWLPAKLARQIDLLSESGLKICHTEEIWIRDGRRVNQMKKHAKAGGWIYPNCLPLCAISPSSVVIHKDVFQSVGLFDEQLPACEDYDMWLRITSRYEVAYVADPQIKKYGGHEDQLSRKYWGMDRFRVKSLCKILDKSVLDGENEALTRDVLLTKLSILQQGAKKHGNSGLALECEQLLEQYA